MSNSQLQLTRSLETGWYRDWLVQTGWYRLAGTDWLVQTCPQQTQLTDRYPPVRHGAVTRHRGLHAKSRETLNLSDRSEIEPGTSKIISLHHNTLCNIMASWSFIPFFLFSMMFYWSFIPIMEFPFLKTNYLIIS